MGQQYVQSPIEWKSGESSQTKDEHPMVGPCLKKQPSRVAFRNNDIYMVDGEESDPCEEPQERNVRVFYKLKMNKDPASKNMPYEEDFDDDNYKSIEEKETAV